MELQGRPRIGVMGPAVCDEHVTRLAREVGEHIALAGAILVCGGGGGAMEAAAAGAKAVGGITLGILPGTDAAEANPYIDIPVVTGMGEMRNNINVLTSEAVIAVHGGFGTLSEIALALRSLRPVITLESWGIRSPDGEPSRGLYEAKSPEDAVRRALSLIGSRATR
jgi:uncharacterized protein (TIGR00725 family)